MTFYPDPLEAAPAGTVEFMPLDSSKNTIVTIDQDGRAMMYGVASLAFHIPSPYGIPYQWRSQQGGRVGRGPP
jgi:hypothetical protein